MQIKIDRFYRSHELGGAGEQFDDSRLAERKVRNYLKQSVLLEQRWRIPVTAAMLEAEVERMVTNSRMPGRLRELFKTVGEDSFLIQECIARPLVVERLVRRQFAYDENIHRASRREAEQLRRDLIEGALEPLEDRRCRRELDLASGPKKRMPYPALHLKDRVGRSLTRFAKSAHGFAIGEPWQERDAWIIPVVLEEDEGEPVRAAVYRVSKRQWEDWWEFEAPGLDEGEARAVAGPITLPPIPDSSAEIWGCPPDDTWSALSMVGPTRPRAGQAAVWTGSLMILWGGYDDSGDLNTGARYDPMTDTWAATSRFGAPIARKGHTAVWTGREMIVWGGESTNVGQLDSGARYDPTTDSWMLISLVGAPSKRARHTVVWTGSQMIVWGGFEGTGGDNYLGTGGSYDPRTDSWVPLSTVGAPQGRVNHSAVWTGTRMIVWGGSNQASLNSGGRYDPVTNTWAATAAVNAPAARSRAAAMWTGQDMLVWGGANGTAVLNSGGRYRPESNTWQSMSVMGAPSPRMSPGVVWTGTRMIIWGGCTFSTCLGDGGRYDPVADAWTTASSAGAPPVHGDPTAVWTGSHMITWDWDSGGRYDPGTDSWALTSTDNDPPEGRVGPVGVWTGNLMVIWGGEGAYGFVDTGSRYDPTTDSWRPTTQVNAPRPRRGHTGVWTGRHMVVWGGYDGANRFDSGARYDPDADTWLPMTTTAAPSARNGHTAVWTGDTMIVWGGYGAGYLNDGGRYDPRKDSWTPMTMSGAPAKRADHVAVWTGRFMLVWGGFVSDTTVSNEGGSYDPAADSWAPMSVGPPGAAFASAVWTGNQMIVWGGQGSGGFQNSGGRYDPTTDSWLPTTQVGAPTPRGWHTAVFGAGRMIVWGGCDGTLSVCYGSGGRYDPQADQWVATSQMGSPPGRAAHSAVWTGSSLIIWGGGDNNSIFDGGGSYWLGSAADDDGDGRSECAGDCNDGDPTVFDVPHEIENLRWADRNTLTWNSDSANSGAGTGYDVMYGDLGNVSVLGTSASDRCMSDDLSTPSAVDSSPMPASAQGWFFMVRGDNVCHAGPWGSASDGSSRGTTVCP